MTLNQRRAWGNLAVWGLYLIACAVLFALNGTAFFWQENGMKMGFYAITGAAVIAWFLTMLLVWFRRPGSGVVTDERDTEIMSRVNAAAGAIAMTGVAVVCLVLLIVNLEDKNSVISPYFLIYISLVNVVVYWLAQAIITLIAYGRS